MLTFTQSAECRQRDALIAHYRRVIDRADLIVRVHGDELNEAADRFARHARFATWLALRELGAAPGKEIER